MSVQSREIHNERPVPPPPSALPPRPVPAPAVIPRAYGAFALLVGLTFWPIGAMYTASGWAWLINYVLAHWLGLPALIPAPSGLPGLVAAGIIGYVYSRVELSPPDRQRHQLPAWLFLAAAWLGLLLSDVATTFAGTVQPPPPGTPPILVWLAATWPAAGLWALLLTFVPDQAILRGWRIARGRSPFR